MIFAAIKRFLHGEAAFWTYPAVAVLLIGLVVACFS